MRGQSDSGIRFACPSANATPRDRKSTRLNSSHSQISYAVFCLKKKEPVLPVAQQRVEPLAVFGGEDLLGISLADRGDRVGEEDTPPHQVHDVGEVGDSGVEEAV